MKIFVDVWPNYRDTFACFEKFNMEVLRYMLKRSIERCERKYKLQDEGLVDGGVGGWILICIKGF